MSDKEALELLYEEMYRCMIEKDTAAFSGILDDSFVLVHMTGMRQSKLEYLKYIQQGTLNYYSSKHENIVVHINEDRAEIIGQSKVNAAVFGGGRHVWSLQQTIRLVKKGDQWLMTEAVASTY